MDIHCKFCGEPWDNDFFHDCVKDELFNSYQAAAKSFRQYGCGFREHTKCSAEMVDENASLHAQASQILSDHPDDWMI